MSRLDTISHNNKRNRTRDIIFASFIALIAAIAIVTVQHDYRTSTAQR
jgi:hypothetical protein